MKKKRVAFLVVLIICILVFAGFAKPGTAGGTGEAEFTKNCAICHPGGGNVVNPQKTLHKKDRDANNVKTVEDIVKIMRNPGPGMLKFDEKTIPDKVAKEIANYILNTFK